MVINIEVMALVGGDLPVKAHQEGLENAFPALQVEIHDGHPVEEGDQGVFGDPVEVDLKIRNHKNAYASRSRNSGHPYPPKSRWPIFRHHEVLVVGTDLFRAHHLMEELRIFDTAEVHRVVVRMERVLESFFDRPIDNQIFLGLQTGPT